MDNLVRLLMDERFRAWVNEPTPERERYWQHRLQKYPEERAVVEQARRILQNLDFKKNQGIDREGILNKALAQARQSSSPTAYHRRFSWYTAAAAVVGFMLLAGYWYYQTDYQTYKTAYGESQEITLPDGSTVMLNANSELSYPSEWNEDSPRWVELQGEAFFSVTHRRDHQRFIVRTNGLAIEVLGTEFNVNHRRGDTEVVLEEGSIRLDWSAEAVPDSSRSLMIQPGELVRFSDIQKKVTKRVVNPEVYSSWKDHRWVFEQTSLSEVFTMIEDNYGYQVVAEDSAIAERIFTAEIQSANLELLLAFLSESFALDIVREKTRIIIKEKSATTE